MKAAESVVRDFLLEAGYTAEEADDMLLVGSSDTLYGVFPEDGDSTQPPVAVFKTRRRAQSLADGLEKRTEAMYESYNLALDALESKADGEGWAESFVAARHRSLLKDHRLKLMTPDGSNFYYEGDELELIRFHVLPIQMPRAAPCTKILPKKDEKPKSSSESSG